MRWFFFQTQTDFGKAKFHKTEKMTKTHSSHLRLMKWHENAILKARSVRAIRGGKTQLQSCSITKSKLSPFTIVFYLNTASILCKNCSGNLATESQANHSQKIVWTKTDISCTSSLGDPHCWVSVTFLFSNRLATSWQTVRSKVWCVFFF